MSIRQIDRSVFFNNQVKQVQKGGLCVVYNTLDALQAQMNLKQAVVPTYDDLATAYEYSYKVHNDKKYTYNNGTNVEKFLEYYSENNLPGTKTRISEWHRMPYKNSFWYDKLKAGICPIMAVQGGIRKASGHTDGEWYYKEGMSKVVYHLMALAAIKYDSKRGDWYLLFSNTWSKTQWMRLYYKDAFQQPDSKGFGPILGIWSVEADYNHKEEGSSSNPDFTDLGGLSYEDIEIIKRGKLAGLWKGFEDGTFRPDEKITPAHAKMVTDRKGIRTRLEYARFLHQAGLY